MTDQSDNTYTERTYGAEKIGFGEKPGIAVVDFQVGFTDPAYGLAGAPLIERAVENSARLLAVARRAGVPVTTCYTAYRSKRDMPHWKITTVLEEFLEGHPSTEFDPRVYDSAYDVAVRKTGASIFFQTPSVPYFIREKVDTVIVVGCVTSGCIRASTIDSFQWGFRTVVPEDCVGDHDDRPHHDNLRDVGRRYADISSADEVIDYIETWRKRNQR